MTHNFSYNVCIVCLGQMETFFLTAYTRSFHEMYSSHTFQRNLAEILTKTSFITAILLKGNMAAILDSGYMQTLFVSDCFPKMYSFHNFRRNLAEILMKTSFQAAIL